VLRFGNEEGYPMWLLQQMGYWREGQDWDRPLRNIVDFKVYADWMADEGKFCHEDVYRFREMVELIEDRGIVDFDRLKYKKMQVSSQHWDDRVRSSCYHKGSSEWHVFSANDREKFATAQLCHEDAYFHKWRGDQVIRIPLPIWFIDVRYPCDLRIASLMSSLSMAIRYPDSQIKPGKISNYYPPRKHGRVVHMTYGKQNSIERTTEYIVRVEIDRIDTDRVTDFMAPSMTRKPELETASA